MLVVVSLGGKALLPRREPFTVAKLYAGVRTAAATLANLALHHQLLIAYGDSPQAGVLALQGAAYAKLATPWGPDGAQTDAIVAYLLEQELGSLLSVDRSVATVLTMVEVDPSDPAFRYPTKSIGPQYLREEAEHIAAVKGWAFKPDGDKWRRVVAAPEPKGIVELRPIQWLLERNTVVIAAGGAGIPAISLTSATRRFAAGECVVEKDFVSELLARELGADRLVLLTDADAVYVDWGKPTNRAIRRASPDFLFAFPFGGDSIGPKVAAACRFATATGKPAAIGAAAELDRILEGQAGTTIALTEPDIAYASPLAGAAHASGDDPIGSAA